MDLRLTFSVLPDEYDGDLVDPERVTGFSALDVAALSAEVSAGVLTAEPGSVGKGAAGPGVELVWHLAEEVWNDGASLVTYAVAARELIRAVRRRRPKRTLAVQDPGTIGVLAVGATGPDLQDRLRGATLYGTVCLTGGGSGLGTDDRDVWATTLELKDGNLLVLLSAPSGLLEQVLVTPAWLRNT